MAVPSVDVDTKEMLSAILAVESTIKESSDLTFAGMEKELFGDKGVLAEPRFDQIRSGCDLFKLRLTKQLEAHTHDLGNNMANMRQTLIDRCRWYHTVCEAGPSTIVNDLLPFVRHGSKVLVLGSGSCLALALKSCVSVCSGVQFYILEGAPQGHGKAVMAKALETNLCGVGNNQGLMGSGNTTGTSINSGLPQSNSELNAQLRKACTIVPDSAVGGLLSDIDFVVVGANAVTEHGGLVHCPGTLQLAIVAQSMKVPLYVLCETFKYARIFPMSIKDLKPLAPPTTSNEGAAEGKPADSWVTWPTDVLKSVDLVPPTLITLLFTEQGIITPSAVAHEMFRIYTGRESGDANQIF